MSCKFYWLWIVSHQILMWDISLSEDILPSTWQHSLSGEVTTTESLFSNRALSTADTTRKQAGSLTQEVVGSCQKDQGEETWEKDLVCPWSLILGLSRPLNVEDAEGEGENRYQMSDRKSSTFKNKTKQKTSKKPYKPKQKQKHNKNLTNLRL